MAASDEAELVRMINTSTEINDRPCAFRQPRGIGLGSVLPSINEKIEIGKSKVIKEGRKLAILNFGARLNETLKAAENLIWQLATTHEAIMTIEEGSIGGFGSHVVNFLTKKGLMDNNLKFRSMNLPDIFIDQDTPEKMYEIAGLDSSSIANKVEETLNSNIILAKNRNKLSN